MFDTSNRAGSSWLSRCNGLEFLELDLFQCKGYWQCYRTVQALVKKVALCGILSVSSLFAKLIVYMFPVYTVLNNTVILLQ